MTISVQNARHDALRARRQELLSVKEFAAVVGKHPQSIYRRIREGRQRGVVDDSGDLLIDITIALRYEPADLASA